MSATDTRTDKPSAEGTRLAGSAPQARSSRLHLGGWWGPVLTAVLSTLAMGQALKVWDWRPGTPLEFDGDAAFVLMQVKDILDHGWYWSNSDVGAPFGQTTGWFADASWVHYAAVKILGLVSSSPATVSALYFFLCFPLAALTAYWLARTLGISRSASVMVGVLFSLLPGHQLKFAHLWLSGYWVVPLAIWLVLVVSGYLRADLRESVAWTRARVGAVVLVVGLGGVYYVAFTLILALVVLVLSIVAGKGLPVLKPAVTLGGGVAAVCLVPILAASLQTRGDTVTGATPGARGFWQSETYAGKIVDLVLPWIHHRVPGAAAVTSNYASTTIATVEQPALGVVALCGVCGLLALGLASLLGRPRTARASLIGVLTVLTLTSVALYTRGGLGALTAVVVTPSIRTWSRFVVVIALLGLLAVGLAVTWLGTRRGVATAALVAGALLVVGVLDQTNPAVAPDYRALRAASTAMATYASSLEGVVGPGCSVFQLPVVPFPEQDPTLGMTDYDQLRPYAVASGLRWSYGAIRGTAAADWQLALPPLGSDGALVDDLAAAGFCAVEADTRGLSEPSEALANLAASLGQPIATTSDETLVAFDLRGRRTALVGSMGSSAVDERADQVLHRLPVAS
ncbi:MAG: hypothetical protein ABJA74_09445 [Lapillicoccus sp.]